MINFESITYRELWEYVELGFGDDPALMEKYQQYDTPFKETVERNMRNIWDAMHAGFSFKFFKIVFAEVPIGFTVLDKDADILFSFGINRKYRNRMVTVAWFGQVRKHLTGHFTCVLWNQNKRAIRFLNRNGMTVLRSNEETTTLVLQ
jgi:hypothetical protein